MAREVWRRLAVLLLVVATVAPHARLGVTFGAAQGAFRRGKPPGPPVARGAAASLFAPWVG